MKKLSMKNVRIGSLVKFLDDKIDYRYYIILQDPKKLDYVKIYGMEECNFHDYGSYNLTKKDSNWEMICE